MALVEPALNLAAEQVIEWTAYGEFLTRRANRGPVASPQAVFECLPSKRETRYEKKYAALSIVTDADWAALVDLLGRPEWARSSDYASEAGRRADEDRIEGALAEFEALRASGDLTDGVDVAVRNAIAVFAVRAGDTARAKRELEGLVAAYEHRDETDAHDPPTHPRGIEPLHARSPERCGVIAATSSRAARPGSAS